MKVRKTICLSMLLLFAGTITSASYETVQIEESSLPSTALNEAVEIRVGLPAGYGDSAQSYPVLYLLDGEFFMNQALSVIDFLANPKYMDRLTPMYIVVGITTTDRDRDFTPTHDELYDGMSFPTSGGAENFYRFLTEELFPLIDSTYRTTDRRLLAGWSLGGLFTTWTYLRHPDTFDGYLAISPSLWWDDMIVCKWAMDHEQERSLSSRRLTVTLGEFERGDMEVSVKKLFLPIMMNQDQNTHFQFIEIAGEGHNTSPPTALYRGFHALHDLSLIPEGILSGDQDELLKYLDEMAGSYGVAFDSPEETCKFLIKQTISSGTLDVGLQVAELYALRLSSSPESMISLGEMYFRLERFDEAVESFRMAITREQALDHPDPERLKYYQEYLDWILEREN